MNLIVSVFGLLVVTVNAALPPVYNVQTDSVGVDYFVVKWNPYNNTAIGFQVEYFVFPQTAASVLDTQDSSKDFFNLTNLISGTNYQVRVRPFGGFNETFIVNGNETEYGPWSVYVTCVTKGPMPPTSLSISNIMGTEVSLTWVPSLSKVDSYQIVVRNSKSLLNTSQYFVSSDVHEMEVGTLTPSTPYSVFINAFLNNETSSFLTGGFQTNIAPPEAPNNLSVSNILETSADLAWVDPQNGQDVISYEIELLEMSTNNKSVLSSKSLNFDAIGLKMDTNYTFRVRSITVVSEVVSDWSSVFGFKTLIAVVPPPRIITISNVSTESATITWEAPITVYSINSYIIVYYTIEMQPMSEKVPGDKNSYTLINLVSGTQYVIAIQAVVLNNVLGMLSVKNIFVTTGPKPVSSISIFGISDSSANVLWNVSSQYYSSSTVILFDNNIKIINTTKEFSKDVLWCTFTNLVPNNPYIIKIFVNDANNLSSSVASNGFRTKLGSDVLNAPANTSVSILSPSSVLFQCDKVSLALAYEIRIEGNPNPEIPLNRTDQFSAFKDGSEVQKMQIKDLISGYAYFLRVRAILGDISYISQWSTVVAFFLDGGRPPTQIQITNINENSAVVRWTQAYDQLTLNHINLKYFVRLEGAGGIRLEGAGGKIILESITIGIPQGNYGRHLSFKTPNFLISDSSYKVSIFCEKDKINGSVSSTVFRTAMVSIAIPKNLVISNNDTCVKIIWNVTNTADILYYQVELYTSESGSLYYKTDGLSTSLDIYSLFPNTYYQFRVQAVGYQNNVGEWSAWGSVVTQNKIKVSEIHSRNHSIRPGVIVGVTIGVLGIIIVVAYVIRTLWKKKYKPTKFKQFENSVKYSKNSNDGHINVQRTSA